MTAETDLPPLPEGNVAHLFAALVAAFEREECAKVCEYRAMALDYSGNQYVRYYAALDCARSIRARENKA